MSNVLSHAHIMRGVPGSGKSTTANSIASLMGTLVEKTIIDGVIYYSKDGMIHSAIHSTDSFFYNREGVYEFIPWKLGQYHSANFKKFKQSVADNIPIVICDNTNTTRKEYIKYVEAARRSGYITSLISLPHPPIDVAVERNTHGVPEEAILKMMRRWEGYNGRKK